ncbi:MAG: AAA family ATPase [Thermoplasmata archaeon]
MNPYKLHSDISLTGLPRVVVMVGRNNTGKSSIVQAVALPKYGHSWSPSFPTAPTTDLGLTVSPLSRIELEYDGPNSTLEVVTAANGDGSLDTRVTWRGATVASSRSIPRPTDSTTSEGPLLGAPDDSKRVFVLGAFREAPPRAFAYAQFTRDIGTNGENCWNAIHQLKADDSPVFKDIQDTLGGLGFGSGGIRTPTTGAGSGLTRLENYGRVDELGFVGSGTSSVLPIVTQGALCLPGETLIVEEPELHLHRQTINSLWQFFGKLAERNVQVILTTHSTDLVASLRTQTDEGKVPNDYRVYVVKREATGLTSVESQPLDYFRKAIDAIKDELRGLP